MNLILHQFKTDVRHFRWSLVVLWLSFAAMPALMGFNVVTGEAVTVVDALLTVWQAGVAIFLVAQLVQADPLVGTSAAWLTRPVRRQHLFWAKSAFILICLLLPRLVGQSVVWSMRDFSAHQMVCAALEGLLFSGVLVAVTAVAASVTRDLARFFLAVGIGVGGMFAWVVVLEMLKRAGWLHEVGANWQESASLNLSQIVLAFGVLGLSAILGWVVQALSGFRLVAITLLTLGLLAFPWITLRWPVNFLKPRLLPAGPLTVSVWDTNSPVASSQSQPIYVELLLNGVPTQQVAAVQTLGAFIHFQGDKRPTHFPHSAFSNGGGRTRPAHSEQSQNYFRMLREFFPASTLWFDNDHRGGATLAFYNEQAMKRFTNAVPPGNLSGSVELDLFAVKKVAEQPVQPGRFTVLPGRSVNIEQVKFTGDAITVVLDEGTASLMLDREVVDASASWGGDSSPYCTYVLHHPASGEAYLVEQRYGQYSARSLISGELHLRLRLRFPYPALREKFAGVTAAEWLREARLVVFAPVYAGTAKLQYRQDHYLWSANSYNASLEKKSLADREAIAQAALSLNPTATQLDAYLDTLCQKVPDYADPDFHKVIEDKFAAIGTNGLSALIRRLPLDSLLEESFVLPVLCKLATRDHLPELLAALPHDYAIVSVFAAKHWEAEARSVLLNQLKGHSRPLPAEALRIAAGAKDARTYDDLRWHFLHLNSDQHLVIPTLEECPGLDVAALVREAWARSRMGLTSGAGLAVAAAKQGLPDALATAVMTLEKSGEKSRKPGDLARLAALTGYTGPATNTLAWLGANLADFRFDPLQQQYVRQPKP